MEVDGASFTLRGAIGTGLDSCTLRGFTSVTTLGDGASGQMIKFGNGV